MYYANYDNYKEQKQHGEIMLPFALYNVVHEKNRLILPCHLYIQNEDKYKKTYLQSSKYEMLKKSLLTEIVLGYGFDNPSYFNRIFQ